MHAAADPKANACTSCHGNDPKRPGENVKTGKAIDPMAVSQNAKRYTNAEDVEKWFSQELHGSFEAGMHGQGKRRFHHLHDRSMKTSRIWALMGLLFLFGGPASGEELERVPPITDPVVKKECGACHMAYQPQFLPAEAWRKMFDELDRHFGADAGLADPVRQHVFDYYIAHAGKQKATGTVPLRITETPAWIRSHREVKAADWTKPQVKFKGNCSVCHKRAEEGNYEDY